MLLPFSLIFFLLGFKARMTFETCLEQRNSTMMELFGAEMNQINGDPIGADGRLLSTVLHDLPVCDLQQELDNVNNNIICVSLLQT